ncbi:hypothetical protein RchiOBHm_Chr6g0259151 [Rosa chinensis]|uniref:Uncharacterized protein n=1 Tax=Rosa chinensis TaxID=74649 RepID=A0A2P6PMU9_ROSCH|nr:hypothetical protein RchiOBHm_Chr6g0259151 [Rosa chinensis]
MNSNNGEHRSVTIGIEATGHQYKSLRGLKSGAKIGNPRLCSLWSMKKKWKHPRVEIRVL